jgi:hypothetical protein
VSESRQSRRSVAVVCGEVSRIERETRDAVRVDDGGERAEVKQEWDLEAIEIDLRVLRRRPPHQEKTESEGCSCHSGEVLDNLEDVVLSAGDGGDLIHAKLMNGHLPTLTRSADDGLERAVSPPGQPVFHVLHAAGFDDLVQPDLEVSGRDHADPYRP